VKQPNTLLKLAVVASSVLLVAGFVSYRAGAFNWLMRPSLRSADSESGFDSSKSGKVFRQSSPAQQPSPGTTPPESTIMSGSKSPINMIQYSIPVPSFTPDAQPPAPSQSSLPPP